MAGPGGGPPRKSHTKSRKGCKTCKRRHIRCDENFPQCRNCTKHNTRCDYMDSPPPADEPARESGPNLLWNPNIEAEVDNWIRTGIYPFPELALVSHQQFHGLSKIELRLVHHLSSIYRDLTRKGLVHCTAWVEKLPIFLDTALGYDFVMSAILAFSATHLAAETNSNETRNLAYHHRGIALNGLHMAIGNFSQENSDPILAASILLSWQASDWSGWMSLVQGISTVVSSMDAWKDNSPLAFFVESSVLTKPPAFAPPSMGGLMAPMLPEDDRSLQQAINALQQLLLYLPEDSHLHRFVEELLHSAEEIELSSRTTREDQLFEKLQFLRMRLLWAPVHLVQVIDSTHMNLTAVAHLYSVAMAVDASLPELNGAAFGGLTNGPIDEIDRRIRFTSPHGYDSSSVLDDLMQFPRQMAHKNNMHRGSVVGSVGRPDSIHGSVHGSMHGSIHGGRSSPYGFQNLHLDSAPHTPNFPPSFPVYGGNISQEDLSVPPSPFLSSFVPHPGSRRHSGLLEGHSPRPNSMSFDHRSFSQLGYRDDSPAYSPAGGYSPAHSFLEEDPGLYGGSSPGWANPTGNFSYDDSLDKNKGRTTS